MRLTKRLVRLEKSLDRHQKWLSRSVNELTDAELYAVVARGTKTSAAELAALPDEAFATLVVDLCRQSPEREVQP
jgi:hypothetical protein